MSGRSIQLAGTRLIARPSGALWWPDEKLLCVADLHLGKSERLARGRGTLLPPYETRDTLERLSVEIMSLNPARIICLGDSFDDMLGAPGLAGEDRAALGAMMDARHWVWIAGNHDPAPSPLGGDHLAEYRRGPLVFRHEASSGTERGEVSGHYHPKLQLTLKGMKISRPCFLMDEWRLVMPAFGTYTGGLRSVSPVLRAIMRPPVYAVLTGEPCLMVPLAEDGSSRLV